MGRGHNNCKSAMLHTAIKYSLTVFLFMDTGDAFLNSLGDPSLRIRVSLYGRSVCGHGAPPEISLEHCLGYRSYIHKAIN